MISGGNNNGLMSEINVTPFVDVMLVLLIIFMVAAPMMTQGVDVALPEAASGSLPHDDEPLMVTIDREGAVFINEFRLEADMVKRKIRAIVGEKGTRQVFLRADKDVPYGKVVHIMSEIKESGVAKLGMITEPAGEESGK